MSAPTHDPGEGEPTLPSRYPVDSPVWMWVGFYTRWMPGYVSSVFGNKVFVRTETEYAWVSESRYLAPRNREEDPCDEESLRKKDWV